MVDIEIIAYSSLFLNLGTNLILYLNPEKCIKLTIPIGIAYQKPENLKFFAPLRINIQKREGLSNLKKRFLIFLYYIQKRVD